MMGGGGRQAQAFRSTIEVSQAGDKQISMAQTHTDKKLVSVVLFVQSYDSLVIEKPLEAKKDRGSARRDRVEASGAGVNGTCDRPPNRSLCSLPLSHAKTFALVKRAVCSLEPVQRLLNTFDSLAQTQHEVEGEDLDAGRDTMTSFRSVLRSLPEVFAVIARVLKATSFEMHHAVACFVCRHQFSCFELNLRAF
jgi:hypothetical protein